MQDSLNLIESGASSINMAKTHILSQKEVILTDMAEDQAQTFSLSPAANMRLSRC